MDDQDALRAIDTALGQRGFKRDWGGGAFPLYVGPLENHGLDVKVSIEITDFDFIVQPVIRLLSRGKASGKSMPHLVGPNDAICYIARNSTVLDRYDPGGTVLRCLLQAEKVLGDGLRGRSERDFVDEFASYWGGPVVLIDLPAEFAGDAEICWVAFAKEKGSETGVLCAKGALANSFQAAHVANRGVGAKPPSELCTVVSVRKDLGSDWPGSTLPCDLNDLSQFLDAMGEGKALGAALKTGNGLDRWIAIRAANASCLARIMIPKIYDRPEFMKSRKSNLPQLLMAKCQEVAVERYVGFPIDAEFLYQRNLGGMRSLAGKNIALIGCGTIGGFLALGLAQSGAGTMGGQLILVDRENLMPSNIGRHLLGMPFINRNKAEGCDKHIRTQLPHIDISSRPIDALRIINSLAACDLVVDATGEEAFSITLNHNAVRLRPSFPPMLHVWIVGNGGAAQALLADGAAHACFKCQKPKLAGEPRYRILRPGSDNELKRNPACGDGLYAPFPVSVSTSAAALALDMVLAWNGGDPVHRFRTRVLDSRRCFQVKDMNLSPSAECPACRTDRP